MSKVLGQNVIDALIVWNSAGGLKHIYSKRYSFFGVLLMVVETMFVHVVSVKARTYDSYHFHALQTIQ